MGIYLNVNTKNFKSLQSYKILFEFKYKNEKFRVSVKKRFGLLAA